MLNTKSTFGQFAVSYAADVTDAQRDILAAFGLLQVMQRSPSSAAEKALAGYDKRPKGFERDSIDYSDDAAAKLQAELEKEVEIADGQKISCEVEVVQNVREAKEPKFAYEQKLYKGKGGDADKLAALALKVGYDGEVGDGVDAPMAFLIALNAFIKDSL